MALELALLTAAPIVLVRLGARYASWLERLGEPARRRVAGEADDDSGPSAHIAGVVAFDEEILVELWPAGEGGAPDPPRWVHGRIGPSDIAAIERRVGHGDCVRYRADGSGALVLIDVDGRDVTLEAFA